MIYNIVSDTSCDLKDFSIKKDDIEINLITVPFAVNIDGKEYLDDDSLQIEEFVSAMENGESSRTSCPAPGLWLQEFEKDGDMIAITISEKLSGSFSSANSAKTMLDKNIEVLNSASAGAGVAIVISEMIDHLLAGHSYEETIAYGNRIVQDKYTIFATCSFDNLAKNGRMNKTVASIAKVLGFWGIGIGSKEGEIEVADKVRGSNKAISSIFGKIKENVPEPRKIYLSHCQNKELADRFVERFANEFPKAKIEVHETRGLCSYYVENHGVIIACV